MRELVPLVLSILLAGASLRAQTNLPLFVHIVSHNEDASPYDSNSNLYAIERSQVIAFANMLRSNGAVYCWQSDWRFLRALTNWDRGTPATLGTNLAAWLRATGHEVDPHSHENGYNYADVAELMRRLGCAPAPVVGGAVIAPAASSVYDRVASTLTGAVFTATTWTPAILWGGGTGNHRDETNYHVSGVRRVRDRDHFLEHSPTGRLVAVGTYGNRDARWTNLDRLIQLRAEGRLCPGRMYTCLIMNNQPELTPAYVAAFDAKLKSYTNVPNLVWTSITNIVHVWQTEYGGAPTILPYELDDDVDSDGLNDGWEVTNHCDLSWSDGSGDYDGDGMSDLAEQVTATQPTNHLSYFSSGALALEGTNAVITWIAAAGLSYRIETAPDVTGTWATAGTVTGAGAGVSFPAGATNRLFHRLRAVW